MRIESRQAGDVMILASERNAVFDGEEVARGDSSPPLISLFAILEHESHLVIGSARESARPLPRVMSADEVFPMLPTSAVAGPFPAVHG